MQFSAQSLQQLDLTPYSPEGVSRQFFHDLTLNSSGLLTDTRSGGLRRDLTAVLRETEANTDRRPAGPQFDALRDHQTFRLNRWRQETLALPANRPAQIPLRHWNAGPGKKVAVVGLGGLGHMAVKIAHAMGAEVTVLSQSLKKQEDGLRLGADHYFATSDENTFTELAGSFDLIINTVSASIDISSYLQLLSLDGTMVNVGAPAEPLPVNAFALIGGRRSFAGSMIGGIRQTQEMLDFCAEHHLGAEIEVIPAEKINEAYERVLASDVRYRFVIDTATLS